MIGRSYCWMLDPCLGNIVGELSYHLSRDAAIRSLPLEFVWYTCSHNVVTSS